MPVSEYTRTITVEHKFVPGDVITDGRSRFRVVVVDVEAEEYAVLDLNAEVGPPQVEGVGIGWVDNNFTAEPKRVVYVTYSVVPYEGCSTPISVHATLASAQASIEAVLEWSGPSAHREWTTRGKYEDVVIAEMEVQP